MENLNDSGNDILERLQKVLLPLALKKTKNVIVAKLRDRNPYSNFLAFISICPSSTLYRCEWSDNVEI